MKSNHLTRSTSPEDQVLQQQIDQLKHEFDEVNGKVETFEAQLRAQLATYIIEAQELAILYKEQKAEKKAKRLEQKKRGKNYVAPVGVRLKSESKSTPAISEKDAKEKKRLYREAMLHVHPDKFSMQNEHVDLATELTTRLVQIYKEEDLETLKAYHAHLFSHKSLLKDFDPSKINVSVSPNAFLIKEKEQLKRSIEAVKCRHTYHVLTTYPNPASFIDELKGYYEDRIQKLKRRTRMVYCEVISSKP